MTAILVINCGSSSLKYSLIEPRQRLHLLSGLIESIGATEACHSWHLDQQQLSEWREIQDHRQALALLFAHLDQQTVYRQTRLSAIAHRVVHGGDRFSQPVVIEDAVIAAIRELIPLAPLHNPANLLGIELAREHRPDLPQLAVFDTAFHHSLPEQAYRYALPSLWHDQYAVRRYGFHGSSHAYIAARAAEYLAKPLANCRLISLHLGNGASACAIADGCSVDTSMGMTPLEGLIMGTRSGDLDPGILFYLHRTLGYTQEQLETALNKHSGLQGLCGDNDMRIIHQRAERGEPEAELARTLFAYRLKKYLGAYLAVLGPVDAVVFTGGIGEHDVWLRRHCLDTLAPFGIVLDPARNASCLPPCCNIASDHSRTAILVINTDEELQIALESDRVLNSEKD